MKKIFLSIVLIAVVLEVIADVLLKKWAINNKVVFIISGIALYTAATFVWAYSLKFELLSKAITVFTILNLLLVVVAGVIIFKENLSVTNKIGIILGLFAIILLEQQ